MKSWILLDSESTVDIFCNDTLLNKIHNSEDKIILHTNTGEMEVQMKGTLNGYHDVWYDNRAMANILSLNNMKKV